MLQMWPATLLQYCAQLTGSSVDAEDLTQETLLKAMPLLTGNTTHPNPEAYLKTIAKHTWIDWNRRSRSKLESIVDPERLQSYSHPESVDSTDLHAAFTVLLCRLTPLERTVVLLHDVYLWTAKETAFRLKSTEAAVKASLRRARGKLHGMHLEEVSDDEAERDLLQAYLAAFRSHNIDGLVQLGQIDTLDPVVAVSRVVHGGASPIDAPRLGLRNIAAPGSRTQVRLVA